MTTNLYEIKTDGDLLDSLKRASHRHPSKEELLEQRVSFVYGSISKGNGATRDEIRKALVERDGD